MPSKAKVTLIGHLGRDPETRYTPSGAMNVSFSMAVSEKRNNQESTTWFRVTAWGKLGETLDSLNQRGVLVKGALVYVDGSIKAREYQGQDGQTRTSLDVNASDVLILGGRGDNGGGQQQAQQSYASSDLDVPF